MDFLILAKVPCPSDLIQLYSFGKFGRATLNEKVRFEFRKSVFLSKSSLEQSRSRQLNNSQTSSVLLRDAQNNL